MSATAKFKVGDMVRCVNSGFHSGLKDGGIYTVFRCGPTENTVVILDENGREEFYAVARFELAMGYTWTAFTDSHPTAADADCKGLIWVIDAKRGGAPQVASVAALSDADTFTHWRRTGVESLPEVVKEPEPSVVATVDEPIKVGDYVEVLSSPYQNVAVGSVRKVLSCSDSSCLFSVESDSSLHVNGLGLAAHEVRKVPAPSTPDTVSPPEPTVDPGEGYRLLRLGESIIESDEYLCGKDHWRTTTGIHAMLDKTMPPYRRKVSLPKELEPEISPFKVGDYVEVLDGCHEDWLVGHVGRVKDVRGVTLFIESPYPEDIDGTRVLSDWVKKVDPPKVEPVADVGDGCRFLNPNEIIREGDELYANGRWVKCRNVGCRQERDVLYRRKVLSDYRPFKNGEEFREFRHWWFIRPRGGGPLPDAPEKIKLQIAWYCDSGVNFSNGQEASYRELLENYLFENGTPCGVEVTDDAT